MKMNVDGWLSLCVSSVTSDNLSKMSAQRQPHNLLKNQQLLDDLKKKNNNFASCSKLQQIHHTFQHIWEHSAGMSEIIQHFLNVVLSFQSTVIKSRDIIK